MAKLFDQQLIELYGSVSWDKHNGYHRCVMNGIPLGSNNYHQFRSVATNKKAAINDMLLDVAEAILAEIISIECEADG